ncbi:MAG: hypothetical protein QMD46_06670 [Methanomicrobiales archaeon]|nr:hypothetical protein [Methanomicrobiales archaeon]MDI6876346.1 hypothetical protein [Methanomicrobiales archaeon]
MPPTRNGYILAAAILLLFATVTLLALLPGIPADPLRLLVRLFALYAFLALSIAAIMTPFLREIYRIFGRPFLFVHHRFAAFGLAAVTVHPIAFAVLTENPRVFLPTLTSWTGFWTNAGRPALIIIYVAVAAVLLRGQVPRYWRPVHALMVAALFLAIVHANLIGTDFDGTWIPLIFNGLFIAVLAAFALKRWQGLQMRRKQQEKGQRSR